MAQEEAGPGKKLSRNNKLILGGGAALAAALYLYQRRKAQAAAAAPSPADTSTQASDTGVGLGTGTGPGVFGTQYSAASSSTVGNVSTNADWYGAALQAAEDAGYDAQTASVALSAFLASQPLTAQQQQIVRIGLAAAGQPPQGPTGIVTAPTGTPGGGTQPVTAPTGLALDQLGSTSFTMTWNGQPNARGYYLYTGGGKSPLLFGTRYTLSSSNAGTAIRPGSVYAVTVTAVDADGHESAQSAAVRVTTKQTPKKK